MLAIFKRRDRAKRVLAAGVLGVALTGAVASAAQGETAMRITSFSAGLSDYQAGGHPDATTSFRFATEVGPTPGPGDLGMNVVTGGAPKDIVVDLPKGLFGNPLVAPTCTIPELSAKDCPDAAAVGVTGLYWIQTGTPLGPVEHPVYNIVPERGEVAKFGFRVSGAFNAFVSIRLRPDGDYAVRTTVDNIFDGLPLWGADLTLWGVPADRKHDAERGGCAFDPPGDTCAAGLPAKPFLVAPSECGVDGLATLKVRSWQRPSDADWATATSVPQQVTGCDRLTFAPAAEIQPTTSAPDTPTGLNVNLKFPQHLDNPVGLESPPLKDATVTLPEGMTINPSGADGLDGCTDQQLGLGTDTPVSCSPASQIGTVTATTPVLHEPLTGGVYIRSQASSDPESGDMFRMALVLRNEERGVLVKLPGAVYVNKSTGRVVATFADNPQLPVSEIDLALKSGSRAPLATPSTCGPKTIETHLTSWAGQQATRQSTFNVDCTPGLGGFTPSLAAGVVDPRAGGSSPFILTLSRPGGQQDISGLDVTLPRGLLGRIRDVSQCAELQAAAGTCTGASQIGRVTVAAGAGNAPLYVPQAGKAPTGVYLAGPYKGAPFSLSIVVPAQAGPFDLGTVVVRAALFVDPIDAHVTVISDPIPTILDGIPLRVQKLTVAIDRPGFTVSPTNCQPTQVGAHVSSAQGATADIASRFQVASCSALALKPSLALTLSGKGQTTDGKHPAVTADLLQQPGQANLKKVRVALPLSLALDPDNANGLCEFVDGSKVTPTCPKASIVGSATATTPILDQPLTGPVYFVKNIRKDPKSGREIRTLPKLVIPLTGQNGVKLTLTGTSNVENDQLVTTFDNVPDAPVSSFKLNIIGGKGGILTVSGADICKSTQIADQQIDGQNNKNADADVYIQTPSCATKIISKTVGKTTVKLKIGGLGAGKVTVTGRGIRRATKTIAKSTVATITAKRTGHGKPGAFKVKFTRAKKAATAATR